MIKPLRTLIVEDESLARDLLKNYLKENREIKIIGEISDGFQAVKAINRDRPDLIFLDIRIPKLSGFEVLELLEYQPRIVFTTAYDEYAVKAFEMNAVDYLLKPFSRERFNKAMEKVLKNELTVNKVEIPGGMDGVSDLALKRVVVKSGNEILIIRLDDLVYFEARDDYVLIHTRDKRYLKQNTLKYYESHLNPDEFIRVHRSYIIHVSFMSRLEQYEKESYRVIMTGGTSIPVSKSGYRRLKTTLHF